jgi:hypothetical protein
MNKAKLGDGVEVHADRIGKKNVRTIALRLENHLDVIMNLP